MFKPLVLLVVLIALGPAYATIGSKPAIGLICAVLAAILMIMAGGIRGADRKLSRLFGPALLTTLLAPLVWMLLQVAPIPLDWFCDPVWPSASAALSQPMTGSITVDTGTTLLSVAGYCGLVAMAIIASVLASDRQSAAMLLYLLATVAGLVAGADLARELSSFWLGRSGDGDCGSTLIAAIGIIVSCSLLIRLRRQRSSRRARLASPVRAMIALVGTLAIFGLCTLALLVRNHTNVLFAAFFGAGVPVSVFAIRRWSLRTWGKLGALATATMVLVAFLAVTPIQSRGDITLALAQHSSRAAELMVSDVPLLGRGAGSARDIFPVYSDIDEHFSRGNMTAAATMTVEMGRVFFWLFIFTLAVWAWLLIRGSLSRGRDYVYAANGAGILLSILLVSFVNSDVLTLPASLLASAVLGLAWAQARSDHDQVRNDDIRSAPERAGPASALRHERPRPSIRITCALFGAVLMAQACWILLPEFYAAAFRAAGAGSGPTSSSSLESEDLDLAASLALVRGDLWAKSALASAALAENNPAAKPVDDRLRQRLVNALSYAPYQAKIWLRLAELVDEFKWTGYDIPALLKMVYYTGANDTNLVAGRTKLALHLSGTAFDLELRDLVERDLDLILRRRPELRPALANAYQSANAQGRALADGVIARADPTFFRVVQGQ